MRHGVEGRSCFAFGSAWAGLHRLSPFAKYTVSQVPSLTFGVRLSFPDRERGAKRHYETVIAKRCTKTIAGEG